MGEIIGTVKKLILFSCMIAYFGCYESNSKRLTIRDESSIGENSDGDEIEQESTTTPIILQDFAQRGLILPARYHVYDEGFKAMDVLTIDKIQEVYILEKSIHKHPQNPNDDYCNWSNYLKIIIDQDTMILWGDSVLHVTAKYGDYALNSEAINLTIASDFTVEASDHEGLSGCDDYSHIILQSSNKAYHSIFAYGSTQSSYKEFATLRHDDGMSEELLHYEIQGDSLLLQVEVGYQIGGGAYQMSIFEDDGWKFIKSNEEFYESRRD